MAFNQISRYYPRLCPETANMQPTELKQLVIKTLEDNKGIDIVELDVGNLTSIADFFVICSATSTRHAKALADKVIEACKKQGARPIGVEGDNQAEWILIDLADVIVHIMLAETREFYSLEKLWTVTEEARKKIIS